MRRRSASGPLILSVLAVLLPLDEPLELGELTGTKPPVRPNGLDTSQGHSDGFGWKASDTGGGDVPATWAGPVDGAEQTITIEFDGKPARHMYGAGECLVIATSRPHHVDHLHRLCTSWCRFGPPEDHACGWVRLGMCTGAQDGCWAPGQGFCERATTAGAPLAASSARRTMASALETGRAPSPRWWAITRTSSWVFAQPWRTR